MKALTMTILLTGLSLLPMAQALADNSCSTQAMAGHWVYASSVGLTTSGDSAVPANRITSIGTVNIDKYGNMSGKFDLTVEDLISVLDITYTGWISVNSDCTGTVYFLTSTGSERTDSIVVVDRTEILGMSRNPANIFTYQVRRISGKPANDDDD